LIGALIRYAL